MFGAEAHQKYYRRTAEHKNALLEHIPEEAIVRLAEKVLATGRINPKDFIGVPGYAADDIAHDLLSVAQLKQKMADEADPAQAEVAKKSKIFEALLYEQIERQNWLGQNATSVKTSEFDDIVHGVDMAIEVSSEDEPSSHVGLAVDATFSNDVAQKIKTIVQSIDKGATTQIKYFQSEDTGQRGRLLNIPRVVIGASVATIDNLAELWLRAGSKEKEDVDTVKESKELLRTHFIQFQILEQILMQLHAFEAYARKKGKSEIADMYHEAYEVFDEILKEKQAEGGLEDSGERDSVHSALEAAIEKTR